MPLAPRPRPHVRPDLVDWRQDRGTVTMQDVHAGPGLAGLARGTVKRLRVVALEFRAAGVTSNSNHGPAGSAVVSTPISENGYFQALDGKGHAVQTMRSWVTVQPGETVS